MLNISYHLFFVFLSVNQGLDVIKRWSENGLWITADTGNEDQGTNHFKVS